MVRRHWLPGPKRAIPVCDQQLRNVAMRRWQEASYVPRLQRFAAQRPGRGQLRLAVCDGRMLEDGLCAAAQPEAQQVRNLQ